MENLLECRTELNLTQQEMAREIGVTTVAYNRWEKKNATPNPTNRRKIEMTVARLRDDKQNGLGIYRPKQQ